MSVYMFLYDCIYSPLFFFIKGPCDHVTMCNVTENHKCKQSSTHPLAQTFKHPLFLTWWSARSCSCMSLTSMPLLSSLYFSTDRASALSLFSSLLAALLRTQHCSSTTAALTRLNQRRVCQHRTQACRRTAARSASSCTQTEKETQHPSSITQHCAMVLGTYVNCLKPLLNV